MNRYTTFRPSALNLRGADVLVRSTNRHVGVAIAVDIANHRDGEPELPGAPKLEAWVDDALDDSLGAELEVHERCPREPEPARAFRGSWRWRFWQASGTAR
ncbi:MAG: hypothetical protein AAF628_37495 [Planctomycetota bacterium]